MSEAGLRVYDGGQQLGLVSESLHDTRPSVPTGVPSLDGLLRRGGLLPGNLVLLGGRTGTRKTTVTVNMMLSMATAGTPVALVTLDEAPWMYAVKMMSAWAKRSQDWLERRWDDQEGVELREAYRSGPGRLVSFFSGRRPGPSHIHSALDLASLDDRETPAVVFVDYLAQMTREGEYKYGDNSRLPRLCEDLGVWSTETGRIVVLLHQLSRNDEYGATNNRNAGHIPVSLTQLKFGGEEQADIVFGTYRPALNPLASMELRVAKDVIGGDPEKAEETWHEVRALAKKYERSTFLQLLKNRPGTHREERGVELVSPDDSLYLEEKV